MTNLPLIIPTAVSLTGGEGDNTFQFQEGNITNDEDDDTEFANTVSITDFDSDDDILQFEQFNGFTDQSKVDGALDSQDTDSGGDDGANFDDGDSLIELTGVDLNLGLDTNSVVGA